MHVMVADRVIPGCELFTDHIRTLSQSLAKYTHLIEVIPMDRHMLTSHGFPRRSLLMLRTSTVGSVIPSSSGSRELQMHCLAGDVENSQQTW